MPNLTLMPMPKWRSLFSALFQNSVVDSEIVKPWTSSGDVAFLLNRSAWSFRVVVDWYQNLYGKETVTVWVPDYFCNSSLSFLREAGVRLVFYPVTEKMGPDIDACRSIAVDNSIDLFLLVHHFGQPISAQGVVSFCREYKVWLIEDAAHVLRPIENIGTFGDFVLYSPHKHLPIPDGAILVVREDGPSKFAGNERIMTLFDRSLTDILTLQDNWKRNEYWWLAKRLVRLLGGRLRLPRIDFNVDGIGSESILRVAPRMSGLARRLLVNELNQLEFIEGRRKYNEKIWCLILAWVKSGIIIKTKAAPYLIGVEFDDKISATLTFNRTQDIGFPVITWPDLAPEVLHDSDKHIRAISMRFRRFYLPVHQTLTLSQMMRCGKNLYTDDVRAWRIVELTHREWSEYWRLCAENNLLQSWEYGEAKKVAEGWQVHRYLIEDEENKGIAIVQVLTKTMSFIGGIARVNQGPLLIIDYSDDQEVYLKVAVLRVLLKEARLRGWRLLSVAPDLPDTTEARLALRMIGMRKLKRLAWESAKVFLKVDENDLLMNLKGKWRNGMRKGIKLGVSVAHCDTDESMMNLLTSNYEALQRNVGFSGMSEKLIRALAKQSGESWEFKVFFAYEKDHQGNEAPLGGVVTIISGDVAIYLIGFSNDNGRKMQATSVLLWHAILDAKRSGCVWFDVGGLSEETPKGIANFKRGLNADPYKLVGEWKVVNVPFISLLNR